MAQLLMATVRRESLSAASNVSFIYLSNVYSALRPVTLLGLREISDDQRVLLSVLRVYGLEVETSIDEILSEIIALKERKTGLVGESSVTMELI